MALIELIDRGDASGVTGALGGVCAQSVVRRGARGRGRHEGRRGEGRVGRNSTGRHGRGDLAREGG